MVRYLLIACAMALVSLSLAAQEKDPERLPDVHPDARSFNLQDVSITKASPDSASLIIRRPTYEIETRTRTVTRTVVTTETRVRVVERGGVNVEEEYTVKVPFQVEEEHHYEIPRRNGSLKFTVPLDQVRAWTLSGEPIEAADLTKRLKEPTPVLASERDLSDKHEPVDPFFSGVLRMDAIVIHVAPGLLTRKVDQLPATLDGDIAPELPPIRKPRRAF